MNVFKYQAKDVAGKKVTGKVEAETGHDAARLLRERNLVAYRIAPQTPFFLLDIFNKATNKASLADVSILTRQFSTMISAGLPITDALVIIRSQCSPQMLPIVNQILSDVQGGSSLADAMGKHSKVFSQVYVSLIKAGESGGVLDKILARLAENLENQREFQAKVKGAMIYPVVVVSGMVVVVSVMLIFVIPKITSIYQDFGAKLPTPTLILIGLSNGAQKFWWLAVLIGAGIYYGFGLYKKTPGGRMKVDELKFKLPIVGNLQKQVILTEFTRTLGLLVGSGIPILEALKVVSGAVDNVVVAQALTRAGEKIEKGFTLAYALSQEGKVFPAMLYQMLAVGEETGKVDETLLSVSNVFGQESEHTVRNLTTAIEPIIMIVLGVIVAALVIAVILPIFNLSSQF